MLKTGLEKLNELEAQGKLPNATIPVLEERLKATTCICGESLDPSDAMRATHRRDHIQCLIDESRKVDALQGRITDLYYSSRFLLPQEDVTDSERWVTKYDEVIERRYQLENVRDEQGKKFKALENTARRYTGHRHSGTSHDSKGL